MSLLEYALYYASRGWRVFPLQNTLPNGRCSCNQICGDKNHSKHPRIKDWPLEATTDEKIIREWWKLWPNANIGVLTGVDSQILGIDIDVKNFRGDEEFEKLEKKHGEISIDSLPMVKTPTGGFHLYFNSDKQYKNCTNLVPGVDVRAEGGCLVAPPSVTPKGKYVWATDPNVAPPIPPQWIVDLLAEKNNCTAEEVPEVISAGSRNDMLTSIAGTMRRRGISRESIEAALLKENEKRCNPPLSAREVKIIARSVARYKAEDPALMKIGVKEEPWDPPKSLELPPLPKFPIEILPQWLKDFSLIMSEETQTPVDPAAIFALTMCSTALSKKYQVHVQHSWYQPLNVYNLISMRSGSGKSPVFREALKPIGDFEQKISREKLIEIEQRNIEIRVIHEQREKTIRDHSKATNDVERAFLKDKINELTNELTKLEKINRPQLVAEDVTPEALASAICRNGGKIAVLSDEGDGVLSNIAGRYSKDGSPNLEIFLKGHSGEPLRIDRVSRASEYIHSPALTVGLSVQPAVLQGLTAKQGFAGKGFLARFWYFLPPDKLGERNLRTKIPDDNNYKYRYYQNISKMLLIDTDGELHRDTYEPFPYTLSLTKEAHELWLQFCEWIEPQLQPMGRLGELSDWGGKVTGVTCRYAGIFHLAEHIHEINDAHKIRISVHTMEKVIIFTKYALEHSLAAFAEMRTDATTADAKKLITGIRKLKWREFNRTDAIVKLNFRSAALDDALKMLIDYLYVRETIDDITEKKRGRPQRRYVVNPLLFQEESQKNGCEVRTSDQESYPAEYSSTTEEVADWGFVEERRQAG